MGDVFSVDPDELDAVIANLEATERELLSLDADLARHLDVLHGTWEGLAAQAQREAHAEWRQGMTAMRQALVAMRRAARRAHRNYTGAAETNVQMWRQVT